MSQLALRHPVMKALACCLPVHWRPETMKENLWLTLVAYVAYHTDYDWFVRGIHPLQVAFILLNLPGITRPDHEERG